MGGFGSVLGLAFEITADPSHAVTVVKLFEEQLAISLGVTNKQFGQFKDVARAAAKDLALVGAGAVAVAGGLLKLAEQAAEAGNKIYEAHEKTGIAETSLSGLMAIAKQTEGSFEGLSTALARSTVNLQKTIDAGGKTNKLLFDLMGGAKGAAELGLKPMDERIQTVLHRIFELNEEGKRNEALSQLMGRGWMNNVTQLKMLAEEGFGPAIEQAKKLGVYFDKNSSAQAHFFIMEMATLKAEFSGLALVVGQELMPRAMQFLAWLHTAKADAEEGILWIAALGGAVTTYGASLALIPKALAIQNKAYEQQNDWLIRLQSQMKAAGNAAKEMHKDLAEGAKTGAGDDPNDSFEILSAKALKAQMARRQQLQFIEEQAAKARKSDNESLQEQARIQTTVNQAGIQSIAIYEGIFSGETKLSMAMAKLLPQLRETKAAVVGLNQAEWDISQTGMGMMVVGINRMVQAMQSGEPVVRSFAQAMRDSADMTKESAQAGIASNLEFIGQYLLGRRVMAEIEAVVETAKSIADFATGNFWGGAMHATAAAKWAIVAAEAGGSARTGGGGGAGGGSGREISPGNLTPAQQRALLAPGTARANAQATGTVRIMVMPDSEMARQVASALNHAVVNQDLKLQASHVINPAPISRGRT